MKLKLHHFETEMAVLITDPMEMIPNQLSVAIAENPDKIKYLVAIKRNGVVQALKRGDVVVTNRTLVLCGSGNSVEDYIHGELALAEVPGCVTFRRKEPEEVVITGEEVSKTKRPRVRKAA
jgi:hypothetical protein